jgi:NAD dependent epimerase/dehydratase family enzyme
MVKLVMGELGASLLNSQKAVPRALMDKGFSFSYPDVESALAAIFGNPAPA